MNILFSRTDGFMNAAFRLCSRFAVLTLCLIAATLAPRSASGQTVSLVTLGHSIHYDQTSSATPTLVVDAQFAVLVLGSNLSGITAPTFVVPSGSEASVGSPPGTHGTSFIALAGSLGAWVHEEDFSTGPDARAAYGSGTYNFTVNGTTYTSLAFPATPFNANIPAVTASTGTWTGGVLQVDPSQPLTISSNTFSTNYSAGHAVIAFEVFGAGVEVFAFTIPGFNTGGYNFDTDQFSVTIPAFNFVAGNSYEAAVSFGVLVDGDSISTDSSTWGFPDSTTIPGAYAYSAFSRTTEFTIAAIPEPGLWAFEAGMAAMAAAWISRRCS